MKTKDDFNSEALQIAKSIDNNEFCEDELKEFMKAFDLQSIKNIDSIGNLLETNGFIDEGDATDPSPPYDKLFEGTKSEWIVAFGDDKHPKTELGIDQDFFYIREKTAIDIRQYRGFKIFLEQLGFRLTQKQIIQDTTGLVVYTKEIKAPSDGHFHTLTIIVINSTHLKEDAYNEFTRTSVERRGYFSISHSSHGAGLWIGKKLIRPDVLLKSPAPGLVIVLVSCRSYKYFLSDMRTYLKEHKIPRERLTFFGTSQDVEVMQSNGAFAVLKQIFLSLLIGKSGLAILHDCAEIYTPIMPSYDPNSYKRDPSRLLVMDKDIQIIPILKGWILGKTLKLPKKL